MGMDEFSFSTRMRDVLKKMVEDVVDQVRPPDRYGVVDTIDAANKKCGVILNGETGAILVSMAQVKPTFVGQTVRISGGRGDRYISGVFGSGQDCPIGTVVMWLTGTVPTGWLLCNGTTFNATNYPLLNTLLGGNTLPDLQQRFPMGAGDNAGITGAGSAVKAVGGLTNGSSVTLSSTELPAHVHSGPSHSHNINVLQKGVVASGSPASDNTSNAVVQNQASGRFNAPNTGNTDAQGTGNTGSTGTGSAFSVMPPFYAVNFIIRGS